MCDEIRSETVMRHNQELAGTVKGRSNANSILDTRTYEIELPDGCSDEYSANVIAEKMYAQCDEKGRQLNLMECIVDHKTGDRAVECADMYSKHGSNKLVRKISKG
jgi:hypothetical protein